MRLVHKNKWLYNLTLFEMAACGDANSASCSFIMYGVILSAKKTNISKSITLRSFVKLPHNFILSTLTEPLRASQTVLVSILPLVLALMIVLPGFYSTYNLQLNTSTTVMVLGILLPIFLDKDKIIAIILILFPFYDRKTVWKELKSAKS